MIQVVFKSLSVILIVLSNILFISQAQALPFFNSEANSNNKVPSLAPMLSKVTPAVVNISTSTQRNAANPLLNDPFFRYFFNIPDGYSDQPQPPKAQSAGSGVIIDANKGIVVTNYHVIASADEIEVGLQNGAMIKAELIGSDPEVDIAVLKVKSKDLSELPLADITNLQVGDFVVAIGNPFGLGQTATTGIVSALGRTGLGIEGYENFIQTDASINPGNSGGALVNLKGELIGINTAILAPSGGNVGIGFAIPIDMAHNSIKQILEYGEVRRGQLGIVIQDLTAELIQAFGLPAQQQGVIVAEVITDSPADKAGVKDRDIVTALDGKPMKTSAQLRNEIGLRPAGETISIELLRDGKKLKIKAKTTPSQPPKSPLSQKSDSINNNFLHEKLAGAVLTDDTQGEAVIVTQIQPGSPANYSGLEPDDQIVMANNEPVRNLDDLKKSIQSKSDPLLLRIIRGERALFMVLQ
ncbi:MAG: Do family serine endopeptidase [Pseudomonadota bacterium]